MQNWGALLNQTVTLAIIKHLSDMSFLGDPGVEPASAFHSNKDNLSEKLPAQRLPPAYKKGEGQCTGSALKCQLVRMKNHHGNISVDIPVKNYPY